MPLHGRLDHDGQVEIPCIFTAPDPRQSIREQEPAPDRRLSRRQVIVQDRRPRGHGLAGGVRLRIPVVGEVGRTSAELVRAGGQRALLHRRPAAHAGSGSARPRMTSPSSLGARAGFTTPRSPSILPRPFSGRLTFWRAIRCASTWGQVAMASRGARRSTFSIRRAIVWKRLVATPRTKWIRIPKP